MTKTKEPNDSILIKVKDIRFVRCRVDKTKRITYCPYKQECDCLANAERKVKECYEEYIAKMTKALKQAKREAIDRLKHIPPTMLKDDLGTIIKYLEAECLGD